MATRVEIEEVSMIGPDGEEMFLALLVYAGFSLPRALKATVQLGDTEVVYSVVLALNTATRRYAVTELTMQSPGGLTPIAVRDTALPRILHAVASGDPLAAVAETERSKRRELIAHSTQEGLAEWRRRALAENASAGPTEEMLRWVSRVYLWFHAIGGRPAKGVEETLGISPRTASRWIGLARERGLIQGGDSDGASSDSTE